MRKLSDRFDSSGTASDVTLTSVVPMENDKGDGIGGGGWRHRVIDKFEGSRDNKLGLSRGEAGRMGGSSTEETSSGSGGSNPDHDGVSINISDDAADRATASSADRETIAIIGSGDFGRALASRMVKAGGYSVIVGSRDPNKNRNLVSQTGAQSRLQEEAIDAADVVVIAVPKDFYTSLPLKRLAGKIIVDVSNRSTIHNKMTISQAEYLQTLLPDSPVVKAFNVLSAYALESGGIQGSKEVFVAGNDISAKARIVNLVRNSGFAPVDMGALRSAREIEDIPVQRFKNWKMPLIISFCIFLVNWLLIFGKNQICWTFEWGDGSWHWKRWNYLPMDTLNKTLSVHAVQMLTMCYFPGLIGAYIQLFRGTKYSRFPNWLDMWLKMRKQLGLLMLFSACLHACFSVAILSAEYNELVYGKYKKILTDTVSGGWGNVMVNQNETVKVYGGKMQWRGEMFLLTGVLSFALSIVLGITSLPSVTSSMTWKEFAFVQSKLGWIALLLACAHNMFYGWPYMDAPSCYIPSSFQYCLYFPGLTMFLKIPLILPGISHHLDKIRGGYERGRSRESKKLMSSGSDNKVMHKI